MIEVAIREGPDKALENTWVRESVPQARVTLFAIVISKREFRKQHVRVVEERNQGRREKRFTETFKPI